MKVHFDILRKIRASVLSLIDGYTLEQLHSVPHGFKNHIAWNITHLVVTQQLLHYTLSSRDCLVSDELINQYKNGTTPKKIFTQEAFYRVIALFKELPDVLEVDYNKGVFTKYREYPTSTGFVLDSIDKAIVFNNMHESLHLGVIMSLKKLV